MSAPAHLTPEAKAEAAAWLARLRADDRTRADERAFQAWLQADPAHAVAFEAVTQAWEAAGALTRADRDWLERDEEPARTPLLTRRAALAAGISTGARGLGGNCFRAKVIAWGSEEQAE